MSERQEKLTRVPDTPTKISNKYSNLEYIEAEESTDQKSKKELNK